MKHFILLLTIIILTISSCQKKDEEQVVSTRNKHIIVTLDSVSTEQGISQIREAIEKYQRQYVQPGGSPEYGCYTFVDRDHFISSGSLEEVVNDAKGNPTFIEGMLAIKKLSAKKRAPLLETFTSIIVYPTWAMLGRVCPQGTTDAGLETQQNIASSIVGLIEELLKQSPEQIIQMWKSNSSQR